MSRVVIWIGAVGLVVLLGGLIGAYLPFSPLTIKFSDQAGFDPIAWLIGILPLGYAIWQDRRKNAEFAPPPKLPWFTLNKPARPEDFQPFSALSCWARLQDGKPVAALTGRDTEREMLLDWAKSGPGVRVKVVTGEGGFGKSRLAAEVAATLAREGWAAGLYQPHSDKDRAGALPRPRRGLFLILDYPEESRPRVRAMLESAKALGPVTYPVRLLLLTRQDSQVWQAMIDETGVDPQSHPLDLAPLSDDPARDIYWDTRGRLAKHLGVLSPSATLVDLARWREKQGDLGRRPLVVLAATVHAVLHPEAALKTPAAEIVHALVRREVRRLNTAGNANGLGEDTGGMLAALAAVRGGLDGDALRALAADRSPLEIRVPDIDKVVASARAAGWLRDGKIPEPKPDTMAAVLVLDALGTDESKAPSRLWRVLHDEIGHRADALARIAYDLLTIIGDTGSKRFVHWLTQMVERNAEHLPDGGRIFGTDVSPLLAPVAIAWGQRVLRTRPLAPAERAAVLNDLSNHLSAVGNDEEALANIKDAVEIRRGLSILDPDGFRAELAISLSNLSTCHGTAGAHEDAIGAAREAADIYRELINSDFDRYASILAGVLVNLGAAYFNRGKIEDALAEVNRAIDLYHRLVKGGSPIVAHQYALALNALSSILFQTEKKSQAIDAIHRAVEIYQQLADKMPARFEPHLATTLSNLTVHLCQAERPKDALNAARRALAIQRRLTGFNPLRFKPELRTCLNNLALALSQAGEHSDAISIAEEALQISKDLAATSPDRFSLDLANSYGMQGQVLKDAGKIEAAVNAFGAGLRVIEPFARANSGGPAQTLLRNLSRHLGAIRKPSE